MHRARTSSRRLRHRYGRARVAGWMTAVVRTPANDRAATRAYMKAKAEKAALENAWSRAMSRAAAGSAGDAHYAAELSKKAGEQGAIISAAQHYAQLPKGAS